MTSTDNLALSQITELQSSKYLTANQKVGEVDSAITAPATVVISTTTPVVITSAVSTRAVKFDLTDDASPPVANFTVQFPATDRGLVYIKNNTSFVATIEISGQASPPTLSAGTARIYMITSTAVIEAGGSGSSLALNDLTDVDLVSDAPDADDVLTFDGSNWVPAPVGGLSSLPFEMVIAVSDETTEITTGAAKVIFRMPRAVNLTAVRASLSDASSSGAVTVDVNEAGASIFSTLLTIDATEKTSVTAATPAVISDAALADDAEMTIDIDGAGTDAKGLKVTLIGTRA